MAIHNQRSAVYDEDTSERPHGAKLASVGQRFSDLFKVTKGPGGQYEQPEADELSNTEEWDPGADVLPRFPISRNGYHCSAVDAHVSDLEQELAELDQELVELRAHRVPKDEVSEQIKRVGEQTSAVLIAANEQRGEMLRQAREEADRRIGEATTKSTLITSEGETRLRELRAQHEAARIERDRMLEEVRNISVALASLAGSVREPAAGPAQETVEVQ
jgi:hypothetical protein